MLTAASTCSNPAAMTDPPRTPAGDVDLLALLEATSGPQPWPIERCDAYPRWNGAAARRPCA